jgi:hypothetical protein
MIPPTEQLVRDYLNRVSLAARGSLNADDRRAVLARAHYLIEQQCGPPGSADPAGVERALAALGAPELLVDKEFARLTAERRNGPAVTDRSGPRQSLPPRRAASVRAGDAGLQLPGELGADTRPITARWRPGEPLRTRQDRSRRLGTGPRRAHDDTAGPRHPGLVPRQSEPAGLPQPETGEPGLRALNGAAAAGARAPASAPDEPLPSVGEPAESVPGDQVHGSRAVLAWRLRARGLGAAAGVLARRAADLGRRQPLEGAAVVLLAMGGLLYPFAAARLLGVVLWLLGILLAALSRLWDARDKWVGVGGPVVLVIFGTAVLIAIGARHVSAGAYVHEAQSDAADLMLAGAVLGAGYLAWRVHRGRRAPAVPPWLRSGRGSGHDHAAAGRR